MIYRRRIINTISVKISEKVDLVFVADNKIRKIQ